MLLLRVAQLLCGDEATASPNSLPTTPGAHLLSATAPRTATGLCRCCWRPTQRTLSWQGCCCMTSARLCRSARCGGR